MICILRAAAEDNTHFTIINNILVTMQEAHTLAADMQKKDSERYQSWSDRYYVARIEEAKP